MNKPDDSSATNATSNPDDEDAGAPHTGKVAGVPYDWRKPTAARLKSRWWNANDHRVFTPRAFGWGFDLNFYEVGRRLRLIRR